jgi:hypothetical protein
MLPLSPMLAILCLEYLVVKVLLQSQLMSLQKSSNKSFNKKAQFHPPSADGWNKQPIQPVLARCGSYPGLHPEPEYP